ncbi:unnamed protein product [Protopolystoma xenopodis]|uniref:Uncharacterized protein n=1 Tax=Protopolystoma xenopodis TaxID=117903 RepID=A0A448WI00_9PLAT|nr:unnamed protein product [Protopolystoma xenopodis]
MTFASTLSQAEALLQPSDLKASSSDILPTVSELDVQLVFGSLLELHNNIRMLVDALEAETDEAEPCQPVGTSTNTTSIVNATTEPGADKTARSDQIQTIHPSPVRNESVVSSTHLDYKKSHLDSWDRVGSANSPSLSRSSSPSPSLSISSAPLASSPPSVFTLQSGMLKPPTPMQPRSILGNRIGPAVSGPHLDRRTIRRRKRRLVGVCLIEPAEDDSLDVFSQYASTILGADSRDRSWQLADSPEVAGALCRLSRTLLHTATRAKASFNI